MRPACVICGCRARNGSADARDNRGEKACQNQLPCSRDQMRARDPPIGGLFDESPEHSVRAGMRGGGRSRDRTCLSSQIPCYTRVCREFIAICREFGIETYQKTARQIGVTTEIPYATEQGIFRSGSGNLQHGFRFSGKFRGLSFCWPIAARRTPISMVEVTAKSVSRTLLVDISCPTLESQSARVYFGL